MISDVQSYIKETRHLRRFSYYRDIKRCYSTVHDLSAKRDKEIKESICISDEIFNEVPITKPEKALSGNPTYKMGSTPSRETRTKNPKAKKRSALRAQCNSVRPQMLIESEEGLDPFSKEYIEEKMRQLVELMTQLSVEKDEKRKEELQFLVQYKKDEIEICFGVIPHSKPHPFGRGKVKEEFRACKICTDTRKCDNHHPLDPAWDWVMECSCVRCITCINCSLVVPKKGALCTICTGEDTIGEPHTSPQINAQDLKKVLLESMEKIQGVNSNSEFYHYVASILEDMAFFVYHMARARNTMDVCTAIAQFIKALAGRSLVASLIDVMQEIAGLFIPDGVEPQMFFTDRWKSVKNNPVWSHMNKLFCAGLAVWCSEETACAVEIGNLKLVTLEATKRVSNPFDLVDSIITSLDWVYSTGARCIKEKSILPALYASPETQEVFTDVDELCSMIPEVKRGNVSDLPALQYRNLEAMKKLNKLRMSKDYSAVNDVINRKYKELLHLADAIAVIMKSSELRMAPAAVLFSGPSSIGKSWLANLALSIMLASFGIQSTKDNTTTVNLCEQYMSTMHSGIKGVIIDDVANGKPGMSSKGMSHTDVLIQFINNIPTQVMKADVESKGQIFAAMLAIVMTTNVKTLDAHLYSNNAASIWRRYLTINTEVRPECCKPGSTMLDNNHETFRSESLPDAWLFHVEECVSRETMNGTERAFYQTYTHVNSDGTKFRCKNINLSQLCIVLRDHCISHLAAQNRMLESVKTMKVCLKCCLPTCVCKPDNPQKIETHFGPSSLASLFGSAVLFPTLQELFCSSVGNAFQKCCNTLAPTDTFSRLSKGLEEGIVADFVHCKTSLTATTVQLLDENLPEFMWKSGTYRWFRNYMYESVHSADLAKYYWRSRVALRFSCLWGIYGVGSLIYGKQDTIGLLKSTAHITAGLVGVSAAGLYMGSLENQKMVSITEETTENRKTGVMTDKLVKSVTVRRSLLFGSVGIIFSGLYLWNNARKLSLLQADYEGGPEVSEAGTWSWFFNPRKYNVSPKTSSSMDHVLDNMSKNMVRVEVSWSDNEKNHSGFINGVLIRKGILLLPRHPFCETTSEGYFLNEKSCVALTIYRNDSAGGKMKEIFVDSTSCEVIAPDAVLVHIPNCPDVSDVTRWFTDSGFSGNDKLIMYGKNNKHEFFKEEVDGTYANVSNKFASFPGISYYAKNAIPGSCTSLLVRHNGDPRIMGVHVGGSSISNSGFAITIPKQVLANGIASLEKRFFRMAEPGVIPNMVLGKPTRISKEVHKYSHFLKLTHCHGELLGSSILRSKAKTSVKPTPIAEVISKHLGVADKWGPPPMEPNWKNYNIAIEACTNPGDFWVPRKLLKARTSLSEHFKKVVKAYIDYCEKEGVIGLRPLTEYENLNGDPKSRFIDPMKMTTSVGYGVFGPKDKWVTRHDFPDHVEYEMGPEIREEIRIMEEKLLRGERCYPIVSACLKDEVVGKDKNKARVFYIAQMAFSFLIRKYFLPIVRFMGMHPFHTMCAVGLNADGPQWGEMRKHLNEFQGNFVALDHSKFDVRMNCQITQAALMVMIDMVRDVYPPEAIKFMETMIIDMTHPVVDFNGTLVMLYAMNPSGNNITVQINSIVNVLYLMMAFDDLDGRDFFDFVRLITYGDDASLNTESKVFTFQALRKWFADKNLKITLPDKTDTAMEVDLSFSEVDFLKRVDTFIEELGVFLGALDEDSILKSLMWHIPSKEVTVREQMSQSINCAVGQWFNHGRAVYEYRVAQLKEALSEVGWVENCVNISYDDRVVAWREKYSN
jgi:hypothetical protein